MVSFAHCKINLGLRVVEKRKDGYHNIETCFYPVPWYDVLEIIPADTMSFTNTGIPISGIPEENLCLRAYHSLKDAFNIPSVAFHLHKVLPMGAGLGGGSSDAAFTLKMLNDLFTLNQSATQLQQLAAQIGSDCSFFLQDAPMIGSERGDLLSPINVSLKGKYLVVVKPGIHVATAAAYKSVTPEQPNRSLKEILENVNIPDWKTLLKNDFESIVFKQYPAIKEIKEALYRHGASYACMSGSGSSVYGIFNSPVELKDSFKEMTYWAGNL